MASHTMQAVYLVCDGCQSELGGDGRFRSATEARAGAYTEGWRFPPALARGGRPSARTHDVCPECLPNWTAREYQATEKQYRRLGASS